MRKVYGKDRIRYLRCRSCAREFSERRNTALFNSKIEESKAISVAEHLAEGVSTKGTSRLVGVSPEAIRRLRRSLGDHSRDLHGERVRDVGATSVEMDERYGYVASKKNPYWEATAIDPESRLLIGFVAGERDTSLIKELMESTKRRLKDPSDLVVMSDGHRSYEGLFPCVFGEPYRPARKGVRGRFPKVRHRVPRSLAHLQVLKRRQGGRVVEVISRAAHGSWKRVEKELEKLGYSDPNLSAIERQNGTSRRMNAYLVRRSLAFARYAQKLWIEDFVRHAVYLPQKVIERADVAAAAGRNTDVEHTPRWPSPRRTQPRPRRDRPCRSKEDAGPRAGGRGRCLHRSG